MKDLAIENEWDHVLGDFILIERLNAFFSIQEVEKIMSRLEEVRFQFLNGLLNAGQMEFDYKVWYFPQYGLSDQDGKITIAILNKVTAPLYMQMKKTKS